MKRLIILATLGLAAMVATPELQAQRPGGRGRNTCNGTGQQLRKRDGSCTTPNPGKGQGIRKQDGTGPRGGTEACPVTPKTKADPKK